jgi:4-alpha-glucanotransferase
MVLHPERRLAGTLAPLFALRGKNDLGVGDTATLREVIDWAAAQGLGFVQMLPINQTGQDHSPYNIISSMALEPSTISCHPQDLVDVTEEDWREEWEAGQVTLEGPVNYAAVKARQRRLLEKAHACFRSFARTKRGRSFREWRAAQAEWLEPYTLQQVLTEENGNCEVVAQWPEEQRTLLGAEDWLARQSNARQQQLEVRKSFHAYVQWVAWHQWQAVGEYANERGVALVGDVPVGVSIYSADVWAQPELFDLERSCGAPPEKVFQADGFTAQWGQNWGFPLYDWFAMSKDNFYWWRRRLQALRTVFSVLRVDHALGFFRIYSFPWRPERNAEFVGLSPEEAAAKTGGPLPGFVPHDDETEETRRTNEQHGEVLLHMLKEETGECGLIAEDLGEVPPYVRPCLERLQLPGFKIPQWEREMSGRFTPGEQYPRLSITTYATHDHPPLREIWNELVQKARSVAPGPAEEAVAELRRFWEFGAGVPGDFAVRDYDVEIQRVLLQGLWRSNSWLAAVNINDLFGTSDRFNVPGTADGGNWTARLAVPVAQWNEAYATAIGTWNLAVAEARPRSR